jgi:hypothetical protein
MRANQLAAVMVVAMALAVTTAGLTLHGEPLEASPQYYERPGPTGNCSNPVEESFTINGITGSVCAPPCNPDGSCPACTNPKCGPAVGPQCILESSSPNPNWCVVVCTPGQPGCPGGSTCKSIEGVGVCTFP